MESGEHLIVGNSSPLPGLSSAELLVQGVPVTYGHIVALGGDFYGVPSAPISSGSTGADRRSRFIAALATLLAPTNVFGKTVAQADLLAVVGLIDAEVEALQPAIAHPSPTGASGVYAAGLGVSNGWAALYTVGTYVKLAAKNFDHFGSKAQLAYIAGHRYAIELALQAHNGKGATLADAYIANAFADHFLTDLFSAGHLRTPRGKLHDWSMLAIPGIGALGDVLSWYVHDEDSKYGINVSSAQGSCLMYGDKRIFDSVNGVGLEWAKRAVEASKKEVFAAYSTGVDPYAGVSLDAVPTTGSAVLGLAPDPGKALRVDSNPQHHILFTFPMGPYQLEEREDVNDLTCGRYVGCQAGPTTYTDLKWRYTL